MKRLTTASLLTRSRLRLAAALVLLGLLFQALIPAGFMPAFGHGGKVALVICSGLGEKTIFVDADDYGSADHDDDNSACPYFLAQASVTVEGVPAMADLPQPVSSHIILASSALLDDQPYLPAPPARGPPAAILS